MPDEPLDYVPPQTCPSCNGDGWTAEHGCNGDERNCWAYCPVQVSCYRCLGEGVVEQVEASEEADDAWPF